MRQPRYPAVRALFGSRRTLEWRGRVARVGREPRCVAPREGGCGQAVQKDRQADREKDGVQQERLMGEAGVLDEDHREHDGRESAGPEPPEESHRRSPSSGSKHRQRLEENAAATNVRLTQEDLREIDALFPSGIAAGSRYPEAAMHLVNR